MKQITTSQATDTVEWLNERRGRITGTKAAGVAIENYQQIDIAHLLDMADKQETAATKARTSDKAAEYLAKADDYRAKAKDAETANKRLKLTADFWGFLAELLAAEPSTENPAERGHRLENENASITINKLGIPMSDAEFDTGLWVSTDTDPRIAVSPDAHEKSERPTWAIECKSLSTANHLSAVVPIVLNDMHASDPKLDTIVAQIAPQLLDGDNVRAFDLIPDKYHAQALQYFVVNPDLDRLYFAFYDPRVYGINLSHVYVTITRESVADEIEAQRERELRALHIADILNASVAGIDY